MPQKQIDSISPLPVKHARQLDGIIRIRNQTAPLDRVIRRAVCPVRNQAAMRLLVQL